MIDQTLAAVVALVRADPRPGSRIAEELETGTAPTALLERALSGSTDEGGQQSLLATPADPDHAVAQAGADLAVWRADGIAVSCVLDPDYPPNLRAVHDRPPLLFTLGDCPPGDRVVAVIGSRRASDAGRERARAVAGHLVDQDFAVASGLAAGIDRAAHTAALDRGGHTIAVIGTGVRHSYPPENIELQRAIAAHGAVISPFWPDARASRQTFPVRNGVMSGLSLASVIVEAGVTSGARIQARLALAHGRLVFLADELLTQAWARSLAARPAVHVYREPSEITDVVVRQFEPGPLIP